MRSEIAFLFARYFLLHLREDLAKPISDSRSFAGQPSRAVNEGTLARLFDAFPDLHEAPPAPFNLFSRWTETGGVITYENHVFEAYNTVFLARLLDLKHGDPEHREKLKRVIWSTFAKFDYHARGFSISFLINVENDMRELLRRIIREETGGGTRASDTPATEGAFELIFEQSKFYQMNVYGFFEDLLTRSLKENVNLLSNILPETISAELKRAGKVHPTKLEQVSVLFSDLVGFTQWSARRTPGEVVAELDACFACFDDIIGEYGVEKIKTVGDAYMCATGVPQPSPNHPVELCLTALRLLEAFSALRREKERDGVPFCNIRIGIHSGPVVAGIVGKRKFCYDIWGDTVNVASRMESAGEPGRINISAMTATLVQDLFCLQPRGVKSVKGRGDMEMFFLERLRPEFSADAEGLRPNAGLLLRLRRPIS